MEDTKTGQLHVLGIYVVILFVFLGLCENLQAQDVDTLTNSSILKKEAKIKLISIGFNPLGRAWKNLKSTDFHLKIYTKNRVLNSISFYVGFQNSPNKRDIKFILPYYEFFYTGHWQGIELSGNVLQAKRIKLYAGLVGCRSVFFVTDYYIDFVTTLQHFKKVSNSLLGTLAAEYVLNKHLRIGVSGRFPLLYKETLPHNLVSPKPSIPRFDRSQRIYPNYSIKEPSLLSILQVNFFVNIYSHE